MKYVQIDPMINESVRFARLRDSARLLYFELYLKAAAIDNYGEFSLTVGDIAYMFHRDETPTSEDINSLVAIGQLEQRPDGTVVVPSLRAIQTAAEESMARHKEINQRAQKTWRDKQKAMADKPLVSNATPITNALPKDESSVLKETKQKPIIQTPPPKRDYIDDVVERAANTKFKLEDLREIAEGGMKPNGVTIKAMGDFSKQIVTYLLEKHKLRFNPTIQEVCALYLAEPDIARLKVVCDSNVKTLNWMDNRTHVSTKQLLQEVVIVNATMKEAFETPTPLGENFDAAEAARRF